MIPITRKRILNLTQTIYFKEAEMQKWECPCGYIYDPAEGDYEGGIEPGTAWEDVPADWVCPKCGAAKEDFWKVD